jgi:hypothetical protein
MLSMARLLTIHGRRHRHIPVDGTFPVRRVCCAVTTLATRGRRRRHNDTIKFGWRVPTSVDPVGQLAMILQALVIDCVLQASERSNKPRILPTRCICSERCTVHKRKHVYLTNCPHHARIVKPKPVRAAPPRLLPRFEPAGQRLHQPSHRVCSTFNNTMKHRKTHAGQIF